MRFALLPGTIFSIALLTLVGCSTFSGESDTSASTPVASTSEKSASSSSERRASSSSEPASRDERSTPASTRDSRDTRTASSSSDASKTDLVSQLNDATRELATLRAANAKLRAERSAAPATTATTSYAPAAKSTPADDRLNQTLRSYNQFRQELATMVADLEKLRAENASLSSQLKEATAKSQQGTGAFAKLEKEVQTEHDARVEAERTIANLREQLRAVARAVKDAGVSGSR